MMLLLKAMTWVCCMVEVLKSHVGVDSEGKWMAVGGQVECSPIAVRCLKVDLTRMRLLHVGTAQSRVIGVGSKMNKGV